MATTAMHRSLTIRLPGDVYSEAQSVARRRKTSLNALLREGLTLRLKQEEYAELYDAFGLVGRDVDCGVDYAFNAQAEVVLGDN